MRRRRGTDTTGRMAAALDIEDPAALLGYLRDTGRVGADEAPTFRTLAGGVSNKTVLVERPGGEAWVLKQALPKLRVKVDWFSDPSRIRREALALKWLPQLAPEGSITPLVFEDPEQFLLVMRAVPQPHDNWKEMLLTGRRLSPGHVRQFGTLLGNIHRKSWEQRATLAPLFEDRSFFETLRVERVLNVGAQCRQLAALVCALTHGCSARSTARSSA